jgi:muconate cycloisomerase
MYITDVAVTTVDAARRFGFGTSVCGLLQLRTDTGAVGVGEIPDIEDPASMPDVAELTAEIEEFLLGEDPRELQRLTHEMHDAIGLGEMAFHSFRQLTLGAVDTALYDLVGNALGVSVNQLLGGRTRDVPIQWVVFTRGGADELDAVRAEVREKVEAGFQAFKIKVGERDPAIDEARVAAVREIAGADATVMLDAQGLWTVDEAIEHISALEAVGIDGVETPIGHPDTSVEAPGYYYDIPLLPDDIARVRAAVDTPIVEHVLDPPFGLALLQAEAVDVFTVEVCSGGITRAQQVLNLAAVGGIDARLGSTVELGPGTLAATALAAAHPAVTYPCDLVGPALYETTVLADAVTYDQGVLRPRTAPGLGFTLMEPVIQGGRA